MNLRYNVLQFSQKKKSFEELGPKYLHMILQTFKTKKFPIKKFDIFKE